MIKDKIKIVFGIILVIIGIIGFFIPIFQGWMFGIPGLIILAKYFPSIKKILTILSKRFSFFKKIMDKMEKSKHSNK